jgi:sulfite reductase alpha subunit-like flavoprotein
MAKDVFSAFRTVLVKHGGLEPDAAEALLVKLKADGRYLLDVWS